MRYRGHRLLWILVLALLSRLICLVLTVDPEYDGYDRFVKGLRLLSDPYNIMHHWYWLPLFQYIDAVLYWLTGSYLSIRVLSTMCGLISTTLVYRLALKISSSEKAAWISSALTAFNPLIFIYDTTGMTEPLFTTLFISTLYFFILNKPALFSLPLATACLLRYEAWFLSPILYAVALVQRRSKPWRIVLSSLLPLASMSVWLYLNYVHYGDPFNFVRLLDRYLEFVRHELPSRSQHISPNEAQFLMIKELLSPIWYLLGYLIFLIPTVFLEALLGIIKYARKDIDNMALTVFAVFYVSLITYFRVSGSSEGWFRYGIPAIPLFIIFAVCHVVKKKSVVTPKRFFSASLILSLVSIGILTILNWGYVSPILETSKWLRENVKDEKILCVRSPIIVLSEIPLERFVFLWSRDIDRAWFIDFLKSRNITYVVSHFGYFSDLCESFPMAFASERNLYVIYEVKNPDNTNHYCNDENIP
ncbi:MAG: hypothetical protein ACE5NN_01585 [Candidatus Bathyarchaeia archaeon]